MIILHIKLWWPVKCNCPRSDFHRVEVMYWPRTAYHWDEKGIDPNRPMLICKKTAEDITQYWDDMWADYYGMIGR